MRVHRIIARLNVGGPTQHVVELTRGLADAGFDARLFAGDPAPGEGDMTYYARERGVEVEPVPGLGPGNGPRGDLVALRHLTRRMRQDRPHVVHTHTARAGALGRLAAALSGVPVRVHTYHGHVLDGSYFSPVRTRSYIEIERALSRLSTRLVTLSETLAGDLSERLRLGGTDPFRVVPLGLDLTRHTQLDALAAAAARSSVRAELEIDDDAPLVGIVGRVAPVKNHGLFLHAAALLLARSPAATFVVVGSGAADHLHELRRRAESHGIADRVRWLGWRRDVPELLCAMDALALTSDAEGTPVALIEALAVGTPVVATAVGGVPDVLVGGRHGRLVPPADPEALADALRRTVDHPPTPADLDDARRSVLSRYDASRLVLDHAALYASELGRRGQPSWTGT